MPRITPSTRLADLEEFIGTIARLKVEGEFYDSDGNLVDEDHPAARAHEVFGNDDEVAALYGLIHQARELTS